MESNPVVKNQSNPTDIPAGKPPFQEFDSRFLVPQIPVESELNRPEINAAFEGVFYLPIPDYIKNVRGYGQVATNPRTANWILEWAGVVPPDKIGDFTKHLEIVGIDYSAWEKENVIGKESIEVIEYPKDALFRHRSRDPQKERTIFGMEFATESTTLFGFAPTDYSDMRMTFFFDRSNGNVIFSAERYRD